MSGAVQEALAGSVLAILDYSAGKTVSEVAEEACTSALFADLTLHHLQKRGLAYSQKLNLEKRWFRAQHGGYAA